MMVQRISEKLTGTNIQEPSAQKYGASEEWVRGSGFSQATSKLNNTQGNNLRSKPQAQELYVQIKDKVAYQIIKHGLSKAESKVFFYFLLLDRFGDRPAKVKVAEILLETGISKSAYHAAISKFQARGWFSFTQTDVQVSNFCTPTKKSKKQDTQSKKQDTQSSFLDTQSKKLDSEELEPLPAKVSKTPQTLQTYSNLLHTLSEDQRESFKKFCLKKIQECSFKIGSKEAWLNKYGAEYLEEFKETYSYALANPEVIPPKARPFDIPDIPYLKRMYGNGWKDAAIHFGLIDPNSPEEEIQEDTCEAEQPDTVDW